MAPLFWLALSLATGILIAYDFATPLWVWAAGGLVIVVVIGLVKALHLQVPLSPKIQQKLRLPFSILCLACVIGGARTVLAKPAFTQNDLAWYNDRGRFTLVAVVDQPPDRRQSATYLHMAARELYDPASMTYRRIAGTALVRVDAASTWQLGDLLRFSAMPQTPSENVDFSYRAYLERQGVYTVIYHPTSVTRIAAGQASHFALALDWLRQRASCSIFAIFPQPESGLFAGIFLGNDADLPIATQQAYQDTGTAHIIAISGFNISILAVIFLAAFTRLFNRRRAVFLTIGLIFIYAIFVGGSPSVYRAAIMASMGFCGHLLGRKGGGLNALGLAAGVMLLIQPLLLWDASFQLSFAATAGLVLFATPMQEWLEARMEGRVSEQAGAPLKSFINDSILLSLAAQITTLPIVALQFKRLSLTALLANPLVLPVQPAVLVGGGIAILAGMFWLPAGKLLGVLVWPLLAYSNRMVEWLDRIPNGVMTVSGNLAIWISLAGILAIGLLVIRVHLPKLFKRIGWGYAALGLAAIAALIWSLALHQPDGKLHFSLVGAEEGTALFLQSPSGQTLLIDPSGNLDTLSSRLSRRLSTWNFHLDSVLLTERASVQPLNDLNARLPVRQAILTPGVYQVLDQQSPLSLPQGMAQKKLAEGESIRLDGEVLIQPLATESGHTALLISDGQTRLLIPGGVEPARLKAGGVNLNGLSLLILNDDDIANLPADMWQNFNPKMILWNSTSLAPESGWDGLDTYNEISITSDGKQFTLMFSK